MGGRCRCSTSKMGGVQTSALRNGGSVDGGWSIRPHHIEHTPPHQGAFGAFPNKLSDQWPTLNSSLSRTHFFQILKFFNWKFWRKKNSVGQFKKNISKFIFWKKGEKKSVGQFRVSSSKNGRINTVGTCFGYLVLVLLPLHAIIQSKLTSLIVLEFGQFESIATL